VIESKEWFRIFNPAVENKKRSCKILKPMVDGKKDVQNFKPSG